MSQIDKQLIEFERRAAVLRAAKANEPIQYKIPDGLNKWYDTRSPSSLEWNWDRFDYRVKPREPRKFTIGIKLDSAFVVRPDAEGRNNLLRNGYEIVEVVEVIKE